MESFGEITTTRDLFAYYRLGKRLQEKPLTRHRKKLWSAAVEERDFEGFEPGTDTKNETEVIVSLGKTLGLEVDDDDVNELVEESEKELSTEELKELQVMQHTRH